MGCRGGGNAGFGKGGGAGKKGCGLRMRDVRLRVV